MSSPVIKVAKPGFNAETETDPNNFIFHSDYNTFKILIEQIQTITVLAGASNTSFTFAHGLPFVPLVTGFAKEVGISQVIPPNSSNVNLINARFGLGDTGLQFVSIAADATNVIVVFSNSSGSNKSVNVKYYCLEGLTSGGTYPADTAAPYVKVAKTGFNALTDSDPRNLKFHSKYGTLKYLLAAQAASFTLLAGDLAGSIAITHNLGYYPYIEAYVQTPTGEYQYCPNYAASATVFYNTGIQITTTQFIFYVGTTGFAANRTFNFRFFLFKNNLGL